MRKEFVGFTDWAIFSGWVNDQWTWDKRFGNFGRANARYVAAANVSLSFGNSLKEITANGYEDILRVAMAYSALEMLEKAQKEFFQKYSVDGGDLHFFPATVRSSACVTAFREEGSVRFREALDENLDSAALKNDLVSLQSEGHDVRCVAKGVRHLAFHGVLSPGTIGYGDSGKKASVKRVLDELYPVVLCAADDHFATWARNMRNLKVECLDNESTFDD